MFLRRIDRLRAVGQHPEEVDDKVPVLDSSVQRAAAFVDVIERDSTDKYADEEAGRQLTQIDDGFVIDAFRLTKTGSVGASWFLGVLRRAELKV